jgi:hypothetical protein
MGIIMLKKSKFFYFFTIPVVLYIFEIFFRPFILKLEPFGIKLSGSIIDLSFIICICILILFLFIMYFLSKKFSIFNRNNLSSEENNQIKNSFDGTILIPLIFGLVAVILIFSSKNLFNSALITRNDYSFHYYNSWFFEEHLLNEFQSIYGFSNHYYAGHPILSYYPPGVYYFIYILGLFNLDINISFRILMIICIMGNFLIPWSFMKRKKENYISIFFAMFGMLALTYWLLFLDFGVFPYMLSTILSFYLMNDYCIYLKNINLREDKYFTKYKHILIILILSQLHFFSLLVFFMFAILKILNQKLIIRKGRFNNSKEFKVLILYATFAVLFEMIFFLPNFFISSNYFLTNEGFGILGFIAFITAHALTIDLFFTIPLFLIYFVIMGISYSVNESQKNKRYLKNTFSNKIRVLFIMPYANELLFLIAILLILIITPFIHVLGYPLLSNLGPMRLITYFIPLITIFIGKFFENFINYVKTIRNPKKKLLLSFVISFFFIFSFFNFYNFLYPPRYGGNDRYSLAPWTDFNSHDEIDYTNLKDNVSDVFTWIEQNHEDDTRILIEESGLPSGYKWGDFSLSLLAPLYNTSFIGGNYYLFCVYYQKVFGSTAYEGKLFSKNVSGDFDYQTNEEVLNGIENDLQNFNIKYLIIWSEDLQEFCEDNNGQFDYVINFDGFYIYRYKNAIESYVITNSTGMDYNNFILNQSIITFNIENASKYDTVQVSIQNFYNWNVYLNDSLIETTDDSDLIKFTISNSGNYNVKIIWEKSVFEEIGNSFFIAGLILIPCSLILDYFKIKNKKKNFKRKEEA